MQGDQRAHHGRGATRNPPNRVTRLWHVPDPDWTDPEDPAPTTQFLKDTARSILTSNASPDVGFTYSINPYRGCEHGCVYCYARPTHEYLGFSAGLDFETQILVKHDAPELLRRASPGSGSQNPGPQRSRDIHAWDGHSNRHSRAHTLDMD